jgi:hypothetical protein
MMELQEKLIWGQFVPLAMGCVYYVFSTVSEAHGGKRWPLLGVMFALVLLQVIYIIVVAATSSKEPRDERNRLIEFKGYKVGYLTLMVIFCLWLGAYVLDIQGIGRVTIPLLVAVWFGAEAVRTGTQLAFYRASARS